MNIAWDHTTNTALIVIEPVTGKRAIDLPDSVIAFVTPEGVLGTVEILDTARWSSGEFDRADAERVVEWTRDQLANHAA